MRVIFLTKAQVIEIHRRQIEAFGGSADIRDEGLLEAAIMAPQAAFGGIFLHPTLAEMAAAYLFHLSKNHPFIDGNKRVSAASAAVFLELNGVDFNARPEEFEQLCLSVAEGSLTKAEVAAFFRRFTRAVAD